MILTIVVAWLVCSVISLAAFVWWWTHDFDLEVIDLAAFAILSFFAGPVGVLVSGILVALIHIGRLPVFEGLVLIRRRSRK